MRKYIKLKIKINFWWANCCKSAGSYFKAYRKSILMIMEIINKVFHNKPRLKSVLNNRRIC